MKIKIEWHPEQITREIEIEAIVRIEAAAAVIRDKAKDNLSNLVTGMTKQTGKNSTKYFPWKEHGPYKHGATWTARYHDKMVETIRLSPHDINLRTQSVRIIAGNYDTWWARQMEYGHSDWHGGAKPFLRPAMAGAKSNIQGALEGGGSGSTIVNG